MEHPVDRINRYTFEFIEGGEVDARYGFPFNKELRHEFEIPASQSWDYVMREFISFLSNIYGYEIKIEGYNDDPLDNTRLSDQTWS
jgi:hypothetical protein